MSFITVTNRRKSTCNTGGKGLSKLGANNEILLPLKIVLSETIKFKKCSYITLRCSKTRKKIAVKNITRTNGNFLIWIIY